MTRVCLTMALQSYSIFYDNDDDDDDDNEDEDGLPPPILYDCQSYFKRIRDLALTQNNSELLADAAKWQEKLEHQKLAIVYKSKQS